jgi:hypothetical protein
LTAQHRSNGWSDVAIGILVACIFLRPYIEQNGNRFFFSAFAMGDGRGNWEFGIMKEQKKTGI